MEVFSFPTLSFFSFCDTTEYRPFLGIGGKHTTPKLLRIDPKCALVFTYTPRYAGSIPSTTLLRTSPLTEIAPFLELENTTEEKTLLAGSFIEVQSDRLQFFSNVK